MVTYDARPTTFTPLTTQFEWENLFEAMGIFDGVGLNNDFAPSPPASGNIQVAAGICVIKGQLWRADAPVSTSLPANPGANTSRTDVLWIQYNRASSTSVGVVQLVITSGSPVASNPAPPKPVQNPVGSGGTGVWQIPIAQWNVNSAGAISAFTDIRQYCGRSTVSMTSVARPTMLHTRLGLEVDTGYLLLYDQNSSAWRGIGPKNQLWTGSQVANKTTMMPLHPGFAVAANDVTNATLGTVAYRLRCGGGGHQSSSALTTFTFATNMYGFDWGNTAAGQIIPVNGAFNWDYDAELIINSNGSGSLYGTISVTQSIANPGNSQGVYVIQHQVSAGGINLAQATTLFVEAMVSSTAGAPSLTCIGASHDRISN
jgi:hypothetical protein